MRFMKRIVIGVLIYSAVYLPFIAVLQAISGSDFSSAYTVGGMIATAELALSAIIKRSDAKYEDRKEREKHD